MQFITRVNPRGELESHGQSRKIVKVAAAVAAIWKTLPWAHVQCGWEVPGENLSFRACCDSFKDPVSQSRPWGRVPPDLQPWYSATPVGLFFFFKKDLFCRLYCVDPFVRGTREIKGTHVNKVSRQTF